MSLYHQGAKVKQDLPPPPVLTREKLDSIHFEARNEAYRLARANPRKSWARRWFRENNMYRELSL